MSHYYFNRSNKSRVDSSHVIKEALYNDFIEISKLEYILLGLVHEHSMIDFTSALTKAYNLLDGIDSESK